MPKISILPDNTSFEINNNSFLTELDGFDKSSLFFGCRAGACGTCLIKVISGHENISSKNEKEIKLLKIMGSEQPDNRLACQCKISGDVIIYPI